MTEPAYQMSDVSALASPRFEMLSLPTPNYPLADLQLLKQLN
jgi:hypothetical protein